MGRTRRQKFSTKWLKNDDLKSWIKEIKDDEYAAYCTVCNKKLQLTGGISVLQDHAKSKTHKKSASSSVNQPTLRDNLQQNNLKRETIEAELKLASFAVEHNIPFTTMDHLCKLIQNIGNRPEVVKNVSCSRTKATAIVKNVLGKGHSEHIFDLLRNNKFSICVDESTDMSTQKHLAIVSRICVNNKIVDFFTELIPVSCCDAQSLYECIKCFFNDNNIDYKKNLIGFAADGANVMTGQFHSVAKLLKDDCPNLVTIKCVCHSLALCSNYATGKLPPEIENTLREAYSFIQNSPQKNSDFKKVLSILEIKPYKLLHPSATRWLSLELVVNRFIELLVPLKIYFGFLVNTAKIQTAEKTFQNIKNPKFEIYLQFLSYNLKHINNINKLFQSEKPIITSLNDNMEKYLRFILDFYLESDYLKSVKIENVDYKNKNYHKPTIYLPNKVQILIDKLESSDAEEIKKKFSGFLFRNNSSNFIAF